MQFISSTQNALVKRLVSLSKKAERYQQRRFMVEGLRAIDGFFDHGMRAQTLVIRSDRELPDHWQADDIYEVHAAVSKKLSQHKQDSGYFAEFAMPQEPELDLSEGGLVFYKLADPGNCGTLIRSAAAFGWKQILCIEAVDPYAPKVVQSTVGALAAVQIKQATNGLQDLKDSPIPLSALTLEGGVKPESLAAAKRWLVIGSEAHGISEEDLQYCQERISIPMHSGVESLNAGVAGSIVACYLGNL